jgi:tetratricopeptide (TPR) repeat protein
MQTVEVAGTMTREPDAAFDVFLSVAGPDRPVVRTLYQALQAAGLRVFLDEENIPPYERITEEIERALYSSKTLLAFYSRHFTDRTACQYELTATFLAGQREGDPTGRIMVINPHGVTDHLLPVELAEDRFDRLPAPHDAASMARVVEHIKAKVARVDGRITGVPFRAAPRWFGRRLPGAYEFVGRYRELWRLHSSLHQHEFALTQEAAYGAVAVLSGTPGIGKSELAAAYAWRFGAAHLGGVYWISLTGSGAGPAEVRARFVDAIAALAGDVPAVAEVPPDAVLGRFADHIAAAEHPSLLVIDDVPAELDTRLATELTVPAGRHLYTVLITNGPVLDGPAHPVMVDAMPLADSVELLRRYRSGPDADVVRLARRLDGHPTALTLAGRRLRDRDGLLSYPEFLEYLERDRETLRPVTTLLRDRMTSLDEPARRALHLSMVCSPAALPTALLERVLGRDEAEAAVIGLRDQLFATRLDAAWQFHALVREAAHDHLPATDWPRVARDAATAVLDLAGTDTAVTPQLMQHAGHLAGRADLPPALTDALLHLVVEHYDRRGEPVLAAPFHARLAERHPDNPAVLVAAARSHALSGAPRRAHEYAEEALRLEMDAGLRRDCRRWAAEALDAAGSYAEADPYWRAVRADPGADGVDIELAYANSLRLRGWHADARQRLQTLLAAVDADPELFHEAQAARIQLAQLELDTDGQVAARQRAYEVVTAYRQRGLAHHRNAVEAGRVYADARLTLSLTDLRTDRHTWQAAAQELRDLRDWYADTHGRRNALTLNTAVMYAVALIGLGQPDDAAEAINALRDDLLNRLGPGHPLWFQAQMVLGYAAAQRGRDDEARRHFGVAYEGQKALFGPSHPQTLRAQLGLAIALKMTGDSATAARMIADVRRYAPASVGRRTELYGQASAAWLLRPLPSAIWRWVARRGQAKNNR